jgi:hypothetical protein
MRLQKTGMTNKTCNSASCEGTAGEAEEKNVITRSVVVHKKIVCGAYVLVKTSTESSLKSC